MKKVTIALIVFFILTLGIACSASSERGHEAAEVDGKIPDSIEQTFRGETETAEQPGAELADAIDRIENAIQAALRR